MKFQKVNSKQKRVVCNDTKIKHNKKIQNEFSLDQNSTSQDKNKIFSNITQNSEQNADSKIQQSSQVLNKIQDSQHENQKNISEIPQQSENLNENNSTKEINFQILSQDQNSSKNQSKNDSQKKSQVLNKRNIKSNQKEAQKSQKIENSNIKEKQTVQINLNSLEKETSLGKRENKPRLCKSASKTQSFSKSIKSQFQDAQMSDNNSNNSSKNYSSEYKEDDEKIFNYQSKTYKISGNYSNEENEFEENCIEDEQEYSDEKDFNEDNRKSDKEEKVKTSKSKNSNEKIDSDNALSEQNIDQICMIDNLPKDKKEIEDLLKKVNAGILELERNFFEEEASDIDNQLVEFSSSTFFDQDQKVHNDRYEYIKNNSNIQQFWTIPICHNITKVDFHDIAKVQLENCGRLFDVITCDPPWQLSTINPTRGVAIGYDSLSDQDILEKIQIPVIQEKGFLFIWVINAKYNQALKMFKKWGYTLVDEIAWVKQTVNGKIAKGHGFYLQHAKETCLIGVKGDMRDKSYFNIGTDVIFSQRRGQSQKPEEIYDLAEKLVPNGYYLEIFGRRNNLHNGWVTIGNEL